MTLVKALTPGFLPTVVLSVLLVMSLPARLPAQKVLFKGFLTDSGGAPMTGAFLLQFGLWDAAMNGREVWSQSLFVHADSGVFSAILGSQRPLPAAVTASNHRFGVSAPQGTGWITRALAAPQIQVAGSRVSGPPTEASSEFPQIPAIPSVFPEAQASTQARQAEKIEELEKKLEATRKELKSRPPPRAPRVYVVRRGDTLRTVALKIYGDPDRWIDLYEANEDRIQRAGDLVPGQRLLIPRRSMTSTDR